MKRRFGQVVFARTITDVDDKINAAAAETGQPISVVAERPIKVRPR